MSSSIFNSRYWPTLDMAKISKSKFPCTQAVERTVKVVTESSGKTVGSDSRDGFVRAMLEARKKMPEFDSKRYFKD